jgi:hypothetical protein
MRMTKRKPLPRKQTGGAARKQAGAAPIQLPPGYQKLLDEFGRLDVQLASLEKIEKRRNQLRKQILEWCKGLAAADGQQISGYLFDVVVSAKRPERELRSMEKTFSVLGKAKFLKLCTLAVKKLEKAVTAAQYDQLVKEERTGRRTVSATPRAVGRLCAA